MPPTTHRLAITDPPPTVKTLDDGQAAAAWRLLLVTAKNQPTMPLADAVAMVADTVTTNGLTVALAPAAASAAGAIAAARVYAAAAHATARTRADGQAAADLDALGFQR